MKESLPSLDLFGVFDRVWDLFRTFGFADFSEIVLVVVVQLLFSRSQADAAAEAFLS